MSYTQWNIVLWILLSFFTLFSSTRERWGERIFDKFTGQQSDSFFFFLFNPYYVFYNKYISYNAKKVRSIATIFSDNIFTRGKSNLFVFSCPSTLKIGSCIDSPLNSIRESFLRQVDFRKFLVSRRIFPSLSLSLSLVFEFLIFLRKNKNFIKTLKPHYFLQNPLNHSRCKTYIKQLTINEGFFFFHLCKYVYIHFIRTYIGSSSTLS